MLVKSNLKKIHTNIKKIILVFVNVYVAIQFVGK